MPYLINNNHNNKIIIRQVPYLINNNNNNNNRIIIRQVSYHPVRAGTATPPPHPSSPQTSCSEISIITGFRNLFLTGGGVPFFITGMAKGGVKIPRKDHLLPLLSYFILIFSPHFLKKLLSSLLHIPFLPSLPHNFSNFPHSFPYNWPQFSSIFSSLFLNISSYYVLNNVENWDLRTFVVIGLTFGFMSILRNFMP